MPDQGLNADFGQRVVLHTAQMDWQASPSPSVWRKRLDLAGAKEASRVTSVVRYDPDSAFHEHPHPDGEEILVLEGVFSDEHGDYPAGSFLLNPEGFSHAPFSKEGCVLFVKLRQYPGGARRQIAVDSNLDAWRDHAVPGVSEMILYEEEGQPERMRLLRLNPGAAITESDAAAGYELFFLEGAAQVGGSDCAAGTWLRLPPGESLILSSEEGATLYVKSGHLAG